MPLALNQLLMTQTLMIRPPIPIDENERLSALQRLKLLDTAPEDTFDRITRFACEEFQVSIAAISLVDANRQWFKSISGLDVRETSREISFCGHTILEEGIFVVLDASADVRFADNPLVTGEPNIHFYAGCPIHDPSFRRIGSLCIINETPRAFDRTDMVKLNELANLVDEQIETDYLASLKS